MEYLRKKKLLTKNLNNFCRIIQAIKKFNKYYKKEGGKAYLQVNHFEQKLLELFPQLKNSNHMGV